VSYTTNQWVKMNPFEAAARLNELERENAALREVIKSNIIDIGQLSEEAVTLREDKERLDWLEKNKFQHRDFNTGDSLGYEWCVSSSYEDEICVRAAIDAARKEKP
jgi:hypothetical protein